MTGLLVCAGLARTSRCKLVALQQRLSLPGVVLYDKLHITIVYSRSPVRGWKSSEVLNETAEITGYELLGSPNAPCIAVMLDSPYLQRRHEEAASMGATYDFNSYRPHVTLFKSAYNVDLAKLIKPHFTTLCIVGEYHRVLKDNELEPV